MSCLLEVLGYAVRELLVVLLDARARRLVEGDERPGEELLVLVLERERESVDDAPQDLQQLGHPVVPLRLVDEAVEHVRDGLA